MGLIDYHARFYSSYLNQFAQPDSIVPDPSNPQAWNRYSYALNNPIRYNDPTGHCAICLAAVIVVGIFLLTGSVNSAVIHEPDYPSLVANYQNQVVSKNNSNDLNNFSRVIDYAASLKPDCASCLVRDVGAVTTGHDDLEVAIGELSIRMFGTSRDPLYEKASHFGQNGYAPIFQDSKFAIQEGGGDQSFHYWYYVQLGFEIGSRPGKLAVDAHEDWLGNPAGRSEQDRYLGYEGIETGVMLRNGDLDPMDVGNYIRNTLSTGSSTAIHYTDYYQHIFHPSR